MYTFVLSVATAVMFIGTSVATEMVKLTASDAEKLDWFGSAVSISGDTLVVGAFANDDACPSILLCDSGSTYVFERNEGAADNWGQIAKLVAPDAEERDRFGAAVSISGDTIVIGAERDNHSSTVNAGSAYVFQRDLGGLGAWGFVVKLVSSDPEAGATFGESVSISGDTIVVGAGFEDPNGAAYVFERNAGGDNAWGQVAKLEGLGASFEFFGKSVSISEDTIVVGATGSDSNAGSVYVFERDEGGAGVWGRVANLTAIDANSTDHFGQSVSIDRNTLAIGAVSDDEAGSDIGAFYVFERSGTGASDWSQVAKRWPSDAIAFDAFGWFLSLSGDHVVVTSFEADAAGVNSGAAYVFGRNEGNGWQQVQKLVASDTAAGDQFGFSVSLAARTLAIGAFQNDDACPNDPSCDSGSAYVFSLAGAGETDCEDGMDNDQDTLIDCDDPDCAGSPICSTN